MEKFFTRVCGCVVAAVLMVAMSAQAFATSKTVTVTEAGTLSTLIPASEKNAITSLTVSGTLNGTDIRFIREMAGLDIEGETTDGKLTELNIAGIELTDGGDAYYEDAWSKYYTATSYDVSEDNDLYYCTDLSYAFTGTNLTKVVWPATMWEVGENALAYCSDLKEFVLGSETNEIKPHAFSRCSALETITLTPKIIYIDEFAFSDCSSLKSIALPAGLEMLDKSCFLGCSSLASVTFGNVTEIREKVFYGCKALTNVVLPATLTKLDKAAFDGCSSLTEITLPKKLKTLGEAVFEGCTALKAIIGQGYTQDEPKIRSEFTTTQFYRTLVDQFFDFYTEWLTEMHQNLRHVELFNVGENNLSNIIHNVVTKKGFFGRKSVDENTFNSEMNKLSRDNKKYSDRTVEYKLLDLFNQAAGNILDEKYENIN